MGGREIVSLSFIVVGWMTVVYGAFLVSPELAAILGGLIAVVLGVLLGMGE